MKIYFFGKKNELTPAELELLRRIGFGTKIEILAVPQAGTTDGPLAKRKEAEILLSKLKKDDFVITFDENGKKLDSPAFASFLQTCMEDRRNIVFVLGGAYGLGPMLLDRSDATISFGSMVWTRNLARYMALEQIYRAIEISNGTAFHKI